MSKGLYKFHWDCGRMGDVEGAFVADSEEVEKALNRYVYFGEILGKHSEIHGKLEEKDVVFITNDVKVIEALGEDFSIGHNPLDYIDEEEDEDDEDDEYEEE